MGALISLFWTSGDVCPWFQSQGGSVACFLACVISDSTAAQHLLTVRRSFRSFKIKR